MIRDVVVIRRDAMSRIGWLCARAALIGAVVGPCWLIAARLFAYATRAMRVPVYVQSPSRMLTIVLIALACILAAVLWRHRTRIVTPVRGLYFGAAYGLGFGSSSVAVLSLFDPAPALIASVMASVIVPAIVSGVLSVLIIWGTKGIGPRIVYQDGSRCPQCAHLLIGNESQICAECGRAFTFEELGTTAEEFHQRAGELRRPPIVE